MSTRPRLVTASAPSNPPQAEPANDERMYLEVYDAIMEHRLPAGTKMAEQTLGEIYGLARHHVRKVLARLAADGLVDIEPNRGAYIASPGAEEAQDMFDLRQTLEQSVVQKLARQAGPEDFATLRDMIGRERDAYMQGNRPLWIRLSADFHIALARLGGNALVVDILRRLVSRTTLLISDADKAGGQQPCSFDEHLAVVDALERKDDAQAQKAMARHLEQCACRMLSGGERRFDLRAALGKAGQT
ncbi:GntR family transcriptional regulator [Noviherbaspirillum suwonense]|jgi:DNA-binding GntR family transcriptional regulator|uniref:Transcriptional regulator, GntR family n=1 Tax=Noviherbaspirillum suwonense TaxID=1224511 RepID=A0ABY1Q5U6_9BURK|nr:GntR family transcriptional regulator [Noviherbaspirillum suwonense]SMP58438.1 transcriptional regulator, GntR family [Noviherbaspirillum suwonense]